MQPRPERFTGSLAFGITIITIFALMLMFAIRHDTTPAAPRLTLLVLPFEPLNADSADVSFGDGLAGEMITQLGRLDPKALSVVSRTSARRFADSGRGIREARSTLGADYVLQGSVRREAGRLRVTVALVKTRDQTQIWANAYERDVAEALDLQNDIAAHVADALALRVRR